FSWSSPGIQSQTTLMSEQFLKVWRRGWAPSPETKKKRWSNIFSLYALESGGADAVVVLSKSQLSAVPAPMVFQECRSEGSGTGPAATSRISPFEVAVVERLARQDRR